MCPQGAASQQRAVRNAISHKHMPRTALMKINQHPHTHLILQMALSPLTVTITQEVDKGEIITIPFLDEDSEMKGLLSVCSWTCHFLSPSLVTGSSQDSNWCLPGLVLQVFPCFFPFSVCSTSHTASEKPSNCSNLSPFIRNSCPTHWPRDICPQLLKAIVLQMQKERSKVDHIPKVASQCPALTPRQ